MNDTMVVKGNISYNSAGISLDLVLGIEYPVCFHVIVANSVLNKPSI